ncbi:mRNA-decapping enzyme subunit 2 [Gnomoniopsis smithogilvyi]|uniref:mRNA-decapping enzyme subunit 2 n=1 Tax=Gnomoniopsis smithogilvyi TaxID=1191159 RepID=A0A9W8YTT9_9PEZI|nr:mRNA-decapping enzyme subunit 2 [Gnomoniopsis smithogilvyi]
MEVPPRTVEEWLDDLCVRFVVNLPHDELAGFHRIGTHVEEAHWFYEDFIRPLDPTLPQMNLRVFSLKLLAHCPLTAHCTPDLLEKAYAHWIGYKKRIPVRGAILLNEAMDSVLLVRGWKSGASWMFPRGKINQDEDDLDCAVREVNEETGFDAKVAGLIPKDRKLKSFEMTMKDQNVKLFVIPNVPMDFPFEPKTRKEIGAIRWYTLAELPGRTKKKQGQDSAEAATNASKFYNIASFLDQLNKWIKHQRKAGDRNRLYHRNGHLSQVEAEDLMTEEEGMTTEAIPEPAAPYATVESHEAATRELHKLLNIQAPVQSSQAGTYSAQQDKGKALLAMLQQKQDMPQQAQPVAQTNTHMPHTPMENIYNVAPQPHTPQHHHPVQRLPQGSQQAPPPFPFQPAQPDINNQLLSVLGIAKPAPQQPTWQDTQIQDRQPTLHHQQAINYHHTLNHQQQTLDHQRALNQQALNQHQAMSAASGASANPPRLAHPQPLPPQANHILAGAVPPHSTSNNKPVQMQQQPNPPGSLVGSMNLPQQLVASLPQPPVVLDDKRRALLSAFTKTTSPAHELTSKTPSAPPISDGRQSNQHQERFNYTRLGSPYAGDQRTDLSSQNGTQTMRMPAVSPHLALAQAALRQPSVSQSQQKALLDILKTPSGASPRTEKVHLDLKENGVPVPSNQAVGHHPRPYNAQSGLETPVMMPRAQDALTQGNDLSNLPFSAQGIAVRPKNVEQTTPQQYSSSYHAQPLSAFRVDGAHADNMAQALGSPSYAGLKPHMAGSPYSHPISPAQTALQTPLISRQQESTPQERQTLLSLFGKTTAGVPASSSASFATQLQGKESALFDVVQGPTRVSTSGSVRNAPGTDGVTTNGPRAPGSSQQAPISPENEKFLLNYLKTVSDSAN